METKRRLLCLMLAALIFTAPGYRDAGAKNCGHPITGAAVEEAETP